MKIGETVGLKIMRRGDISRTARPKMPIHIEYEDSDYTYISSEYSYRQLQRDIETIKKPITILWR